MLHTHQKEHAIYATLPSILFPTFWARNAQFVAGLGRGSASLVWHLSEWTLTSVGGFSGAVARVLQRSLRRSPADTCGPCWHVLPLARLGVWNLKDAWRGSCAIVLCMSFNSALMGG